MKDTFSKTVPALIIAIGIAVLGLLLKAGFDNFSFRDRVVTVRGLAEREVKANKVTWPVVYKEVGNDLQQIYTRITQGNQTVIDYLTANGIAPEDILVQAPVIIDLQAERYSNHDVPFRYNVTSVIVVTSTNVDLVNSLIKRQTELLRKGLAIVSGDYQYQTIYEYTGLNDIKPEMIAEATEAARQAANKFASDSQSRLGKIKTASQGQFSIEDRDPYTPYLKKVRVVSTIVFYLED